MWVRGWVRLWVGGCVMCVRVRLYVRTRKSVYACVRARVCTFVCMCLHVFGAHVDVGGSMWVGVDVGENGSGWAYVGGCGCGWMHMVGCGCGSEGLGVVSMWAGRRIVECDLVCERLHMRLGGLVGERTVVFCSTWSPSFLAEHFRTYNMGVGKGTLSCPPVAHDELPRKVFFLNEVCPHK